MAKTAIPTERRISGKQYLLSSTHKTKQLAEKKARKLRNEYIGARIFKFGKFYAVYFR